MNPNTVIRPWLRLVGKTWGNTQAHEYRWPDAGTRPQVEYFTYRQTGMIESNPRPVNSSTAQADNTTLNRTNYAQWITTVEINIHRSQNGMVELAKCIVAAKSDNPNIKNFFNAGGCALFKASSIENLTEAPADEEGLKERYHHRVIVQFYENVSISFEENNEVVQEINVTLGEWDT